MKYPLLIMLVGLYAFFTFVVILFTRVEILRREERSQWVKDLLTQNNLQDKGGK